ncbi:MAG TPA: helix-turn-helix transcriptional regulator [Candidatus Cryosericum sp.]|nr:helix-turn-helix transcriptional regulator [Candidatus Cryosericum sp.]
MKTKDLTDEVRKASNFDRVLERCKSEFVEEDFTRYLDSLMEAHQISKTNLIIRANMDKGYAYQIFRGERAPSRDILLKIAIGLTATLEETKMLLQLGGKSELYPRVKRDAAILFCLEKGYSIIDTQIFLSDRNLPLLKE